MRNLSFLFLYFVILLLAANSAWSQQVKVGIYTDDALYMKQADEHEGSYLTDFLNIIGRYAGWDFSYVEISRDSASKSLQDGTVDVLPFFGRDANSDGSILFSDIPSASGSLVLASNRKVDLKYIRIGMFRSAPPELRDQIKRYAQSQGIEYSIFTYDTTEKLMDDLYAGKLDAFMTIDLTLPSDMYSLATLETVYFYIAVNSANKTLFDNLNNALSLTFSLNPSFTYTLREKYIPISKQSVVNFTLREQNYIENNPALTVAVMENQKPLCYATKNGYTGLMIDLLDAVSAQIGIKFNYVGAATYKEAVAMVTSGKADILYSMGSIPSAEVSRKIKVSNPLMTQNLSLISRHGTIDKGSCTFIAVEDYQYSKDFIDEKFAPANVIWTKDTAECIDKVINVPNSFAILPSLEVKYYNDTHLFSHIKIEDIDFSNTYCIGISSRCDGELCSLIDKAVFIMTASMLDNYMTHSEELATNFASLIKRNPVVFLSLLMVIVFLAAVTVFMMITMNLKRRKDKQIEQAMNLANRDRMTGLFNHIAYEKLVNGYLSFLNDESISVFVMFDVDNFKSVNDTLGHGKGDYVIVSVANLLLQIFRQGDLKCRMGGDEFSVFMKNVSDVQAIEKKLQLFKDKVHEHFVSVNFDINITLSIGAVYCIGHQDSGFDKLYKAADDALYSVKKKGKNAFIVVPCDQ